MIVYLACLILLSIGLYCVLTKRNIIKIIVGLAIMEYAVNLFLVVIGYRREGMPPILTPEGGPQQLFVDPLPQALVLTSIVIGLAVLALMVALAVRLYEKYNTLDVEEMRRLKG